MIRRLGSPSDCNSRFVTSMKKQEVRRPFYRAVKASAVQVSRLEYYAPAWYPHRLTAIEVLGSTMTRIDQFESVFRSAAKHHYEDGALDILRVFVFTDGESEAGDVFVDMLKGFLGELPSFQQIKWTAFHGSSDSIAHMLKAIQDGKPDLICTYRNLYGADAQWAYTLGDHVEVLTQVTDVPVLLMPRMAPEGPPVDTARVMAVTDHLTGDHRLVRFAAGFTRRSGSLFLAHVEDDSVFERYMAAIGKIPEIDTEMASELIRERLLRDAQDYVKSCQSVLSDRHLTVISRVLWGHRLNVYQELIRRDEIGLVVMNTKDEDQLAMHGLAYPLAVEFNKTPLLLL